MIDWHQPLEAVHDDGRIARLRLLRIDHAGDGWTNNGNIHRYDELCWSPGGETEYEGWRIRNVQTAAASWRTSADQLDRMDALVQRLAQMRPEAGNLTLQRACNEAAAIIVDREPTNPRFDKVMNVLLTNSTVVANDAGLRRLTRDVLAALDA